MSSLSSKPPALLAAVVALALVLPAAACDRGDERQAERGMERVGEQIDQIGEDVEDAWRDAEPEVREGVRDAGEAVGKGIEAAGEALQRGGEQIQRDVRDHEDSTLPDTVSRDTVILQ